MTRLPVFILTLTVFLASASTVVFANDANEQGEGVANELRDHSSPEIRAASLITLGAAGDRSERRALQDYRSDNESQIRLFAGFASMLAGERTAQSFSVEQLRNDRRVYDSLQRAAVILDDRQLSGLLTELVDGAEAPLRREVYRFMALQTGEIYQILGSEAVRDDEEVRRAAMLALLFNVRPAALEIANILVRHRNEEIRRQTLAITDALMGRPDLRADLVALLEGLLSDREVSIQDAAARQLVALNHRQGTEHLVTRLASLEGQERNEVLTFLLQHDVRADLSKVKALIDKVEAEEAPNQEERALLYELAATSRDQSFFETMVSKFNGNVFEDRLVAVRALGRSTNSDALELLTRGLFEGQTVMRLHSARGLGRLGDTQALEALRRALNDRDREVRLAVIDSLGQIRAVESTQVLRLALNEQDPEFQTRLVAALKNIGLDATTRGLEMMLRSRNLQIQWEAFRALTTVNPEAAERHIGAALRNPPDTFGSEINPAQLPAEIREAIYRRLLTHSAQRVRAIAVDHVSKYRSELLPLVRTMVASDELQSDVRQGLVGILLAEDSQEDLARLDQIMRSHRHEFAAELVGWHLATKAPSSFEGSFRGFLTGDDSVMKAIAAYALTNLD